MDQNISAAMVDSPDNKLKKGNAVSENAVFVKTMISRKIFHSISLFFSTIGILWSSVSSMEYFVSSDYLSCMLVCANAPIIILIEK